MSSQESVYSDYGDAETVHDDHDDNVSVMTAATATDATLSHAHAPEGLLVNTQTSPKPRTTKATKAHAKGSRRRHPGRSRSVRSGRRARTARRSRRIR